MIYSIWLYRTQQGWMAKHNDPSIVDLFGTDTLPTAFTMHADEGEVLATIRDLNPKCCVVVDPGASVKSFANYQ